MTVLGKTLFYWFNGLPNINFSVNFIGYFVYIYPILPTLLFSNMESPHTSDGDKIHRTSLHSSRLVCTLLLIIGSPIINNKHGIEIIIICPPLAKNFFHTAFSCVNEVYCSYITITRRLMNPTSNERSL